VTYGGNSGNRIFVLYWRCPLITVSVIRGSTVVATKFMVLLQDLRMIGGSADGRTGHIQDGSRKV
jgi:hypothetical protein